MFFKECNDYNEYNQGFRLGMKIGSNHANLFILGTKSGIHTIAYKVKSD